MSLQRPVLCTSYLSRFAMGIALFVLTQTAPAQELRGSGDLGLVIERASGSVQLLDTTRKAALQRVEGLGDLSHASTVFSRDARYAYVFGRDGGLSKIDLLAGKIVKRIIQSGNSIGGAISQDGSIIAAANYKPGGVKFFDSETLQLLSEIPARSAVTGELSKVVGLEEAAGNRFTFSLFEAGEIWQADLSKDPKNPQITRHTGIGKEPYDALVTGDGRWYVAGLFGEDGIAVLDLWHPERGVKRALPDYGKGEQKLPVYKMPHLETWAVAGNLAFINLTGTIQTIPTPLPKDGPHAFAANKWFHAAVTYNGQAGVAGNLKFYWTALDSGESQAVQLGLEVGQLLGDLFDLGDDLGKHRRVEDRHGGMRGGGLQCRGAQPGKGDEQCLHGVRVPVATR